MDLGCLDMGCISVSDKKLDSENKGNDSGSESVSATSKIGKNKQMKENEQTTLNSVNKSASQIKKPGHRSRNSPVNWFPRKKVDSYLKKKIQMLQEVAGMNSTLDETLGDSNPHYSKVLKEKMASREAANKAIEARKTALVEASWCRILKAARIQSKEAEAQLVKAEETAAEAFEAALAIGVNMYDVPNCPREPRRSEKSASGSASNHGVTACFETAFEADKEVAAAVKSALVRLADDSPSQRDESNDLLREISQNPERSCDSTTSEPRKNSPESSRRRRRRRRSVKRHSLEDAMFERLERLNEAEISSLATIVATCGLGAALAEIENDRLLSKGHGTEPKETESFQSLDKLLVKHVSRLEREVQEAKNRRKNNEAPEGKENRGDPNAVQDSLEKILVKPAVHGLEREKKTRALASESETRKRKPSTVTTEECESLDKVLVKHVSKLEREKMRFVGSEESEYTRSKKNRETEELDGLDKILVKHRSRLEREKLVASSQRQEEDKNNNNSVSAVVSRREARERELQQAWGGLGLGNSMKKPHLSKLERDKAAWIKAEEEERKQATVFSD